MKEKLRDRDLERVKTEQINKIANNEARINTLEKTDIQQNDDIDTLDDHKIRINDLEVNDVKQDGDIQSLQSLSHQEKNRTD